MPENENTIHCPDCDAVIGKTEKKCPACGSDLEEMEEATKVVERALARIEKKKKAAMPPTPAPAPAPAKKGFKFFKHLGGE